MLPETGHFQSDALQGRALRHPQILIGKLLSNNLINLGIYDEVKKELEAAGKSLAEIEELEPEPSLGNGGLDVWPPASWIPSPRWA
ncbi:MAG: hypothetical protein V8S58_15090 [Lachnospiraceae bacterium]